MQWEEIFKELINGMYSQRNQSWEFQTNENVPRTTRDEVDKATDCR